MPPAWRRYLRFRGPNVEADVDDELRFQVFSMVLRRSLAVVAAGIAVGLLLAFGAARAIGGLLAGVRPSDPVTFALTAAVLLGVGLAASYAPTRCATRINPTDALRQE